MFQYLVKKTKKAMLSTKVTAKKDLRNKERGNLKSYAQVVHSLLRRYVTEETIAEADAEIKQLRQPRQMSPQEHAQEI